MKDLMPILLFSCFFLSITNCSKEDDPLPSLNEEELLYAEEAFPSTSGDTVSITYNGTRITCELINGVYVYQGDIIIDPSTLKSTAGGGIEGDSKRWPYGIAYYVIADNVPRTERITEAIKHYEQRTDIIFEERTDEEDYIEIIWDDDGCASELGMIGGKQNLWLADWGTTGTVVHELGHALGLIHEQSKKNRDDYVTIVWDNIVQEQKHNFQKYPNSMITEGFDFSSVMMYSSKAFSKNGKSTITKKDGTGYAVQRNGLSDEDVQILSMMYSDLHDPVWVDGFTDQVSNIGIASDGKYYYTIGSGEASAAKINKYDNDNIRLGSYRFDNLKGRGLEYNKSDGYLYASVQGGHILRFTDLENEKHDTVYRSIMQSEDGSFALSKDGEKMYDFYNGTLKVYDFKTGELWETITGLSCGSDVFGGAAAVTVDYSYIYTWNAYSNTVYVYNHKGVFQRTLEEIYGVGGSLTVMDGYLYTADDPWYDPGYWNVYNIGNPIEE